MAAIYPSSSPMACDTVASFSVLEEASSVGDDYLLLDTPASLSARPVDQEETQPFAPSLVGPDVNMTREDIEAQLNEFQDCVSPGPWLLDSGPPPAHRPFLSPR